jgi:hypothetical protein
MLLDERSLTQSDAGCDRAWHQPRPVTGRLQFAPEQRIGRNHGNDAAQLDKHARQTNGK